MSKLTRRLIAAMLLAVAVYGFLVLYRGASAVATSFSGYAWWTFAAACALAFANYIIRFLKWEYYLALLDVRGIPKWESLLTFLSGFVLTVTPGKVGEVFKSIILNQTRGISIARTAPIVVAERLTDLIGVIILITVGSLKLPGGVAWASAGTVIVAGILAIVASPRLARGVLGPLHRAGRIGARVAPKLEEALAQLRVLTTPGRLLWPTLLSTIAWALEGVGLWVILKGFGSAPSLGFTTFFYATATLAGALVPVPGGLGVVEKLLEEQMYRLGRVPSATATAAMLLVRFATLWFAVAIGFAALGILRVVHPGLRSNGVPASDDPDPAPKARPPGTRLPEKTP
jgi:uncharacterized protein (TIRG00374 family)